MKRYFSIAIMSLFAVSCADWTVPEDLDLQAVKDRSDEYYAALRAYKASDHQVAFGWFGHWDPDKPSPSNSFKSAPDSLDILSLWGWSLDGAEYSQSKLDDIKYIQDVRGTKVTATLLLLFLPERYTRDIAGVEQFAEDVAAKALRQGLAGFDIDWEPGISGFPFDFENREWMEAFTYVLSKYFGPKSGTDRLFLIDGVTSGIASTNGMKKEMIELFDYAIFQTYGASTSTSLQNTANSAINFGWRPEQIIFTETLEKYRTTGGVDFTNRDNTKTYSLNGMGLFEIDATIDGVRGYYRKGGIGVYHMEYDYDNNPDYTFFRRAIQSMNPAGKQPKASGLITPIE